MMYLIVFSLWVMLMRVQLKEVLSVAYDLIRPS